MSEKSGSEEPVTITFEDLLQEAETFIKELKHSDEFSKLEKFYNEELTAEQQQNVDDLYTEIREKFGGTD